MPTARHERSALKVSLPSLVVDLLGSTPAAASARLRELALMELFRRGEISGGYAAEVLGISRWELIQLLGSHGVPYVDMTPVELRDEVEAARAFLKPIEAESSQTPAR
jgi:predicted HTH domain antitoxin